MFHPTPQQKYTVLKKCISTRAVSTLLEKNMLIKTAQFQSVQLLIYVW